VVKSLNLTKAERKTLAQICDAFVPSVDSKVDRDFFRRSATDIDVDKEIVRVIEQEFSEEQRKQTSRLLRLFENPILNLILNGRLARFSRMDAAGREKYLLNFAYSTLALKRTAFQALKRLVCFTFYGYVPPGTNGNPNWASIGYQGREVIESADSAQFVPLIPEHDGQGFQCDVCIVGSGAGGSIIAEHLSSSGWKVIVVDAGEYLCSEDFKGQEYNMMPALFEQRGRAATRDLSFSLLEGRVVGGSTIVNWNTCIRPELWLRKEWEREGISNLTSDDFDSYIDFVWNSLRVNSNESQLNPNNEVLFRGCASLGYKIPQDYDVIYRNAVGCKSRCTFCTFGCQYACKQSTPISLLPSASKLGCKFIFNSKVDNIHTSDGRAAGVSAIFKGKVGFQIKSKIVVLAAGSINTPAILLRSGLRRKVGDNLRLHPTTAVSGHYEQVIKMWEGPPQTCKVTKGRNLDGKHHGFWLEAVPAHPALFSSAIPWNGGKRHKELMSEIPHNCGTIVLVREAASGKVSIDKHGDPLCDYKMAQQDKQSMIEGMIETAKILSASGATKLSTLHSDGFEIESSGHGKLTSSDLDRFDSGVRRRGIVPNKISLFSAHIMGSARMGHEESSFCNDNAESYELPGLFIGDASIFPTSPGINPMIAIMSMAKRNAAKIDILLKQNIN
jgi:choline dehydrogenase-like flavoprotein